MATPSSTLAWKIPWMEEPGGLPSVGSQSRTRLMQLSSHYEGREGNGTPPQYSCLENPIDGGAWWAAVHRVAKSRTRLSNFTFTFCLHALEEEMETHSSILAWRLPGTEEPGGLPSVGSQSRTRLMQLSSHYEGGIMVTGSLKNLEFS